MPWPSSFAQGTLGMMKDRISDELMRSDLTTQIAAAINTAIAIYQNEFLRFTETYTATFRTEDGKWEYNLLTDISNSGLTQTLQLVQVSNINCQMEDGSSMWELSREQPENIIVYNLQSTMKGQPDSYSWDADTILIGPVPDKGRGALGGVITLGLTTGGSNYASGIFLNVPLTGGHGIGAEAAITVVAGAVTSAVLTEKGQSYSVGDILSANPASLNVTSLDPVNGLISEFTLLSGGDGFLGGAFTNVPLTGGSGSGATANIVVTDQTQNSNTESGETTGLIGGPVTSVQITNPGVDYLDGDVLSANLAPAVANNASGGVGNVTVLFSGPGFTPGTYTSLALTGGSGSGATANIIVAGSGSIQSAVINNRGIGYLVGDTLTIPVPGASGQIASIGVLSHGELYSPDGTYTRPVVASSGSPPGSGATVGVIVFGGIIAESVSLVSHGTGYRISDGENGDSYTISLGGGLTSGDGLIFSITGVGAALRVDTLNTGGIPGLISGLASPDAGNVANGTYLNVPLVGGAGSGATANIVISGGSATGVAIVHPGRNYLVGDVLSAPSIGTEFEVTVSAIKTGAVNSGIAGGFQIQITNVEQGTQVTQVSGAGFAATISQVITDVSGYIISILGTWAYSAPSNDRQTGNRWMTHAERLIRSRAKYEIAVHVTRNEQMAQSMSPYEPPPGQRPGATYEALRDLMSAANRIVRRGRIAPMPW